ncbi:MAG: O-antigen ligase family protein [Eubacterium ventriosum]
MAIVVVVGISIVIFRIQYIFFFIIENILGKTLTLSSRTIIWDKALALIGKESIIGYGAGTLATVIQDRNAHCFFLQILIQSGIIGLLCYINVFRVVLKKCKKYSKLKSYIIINSCICGYLTCCITEVYSQNF